MNDIYVAFGQEIKALGDGKVGGYGVTFGGSDLEGDYFTKSTYFGAHHGDGVDCLFHHSLPVPGVKAEYQEHIFSPVKAKVDDIGIFVEVVLDMANAYEAAVYGLATKGKLGWSSGSPSHMVRRAEDGEIKRWPIAEFSLTPTPAEPRNRVTSLKALKASGISQDMRREILYRALCAEMEDGDYCWICDIYDNSVVFCQGETCYEATYTIEGLSATIGTPKEVMRVVTYKPLPNGNAKTLVETERDFERFLREAGFAKSAAVAITSHGYKALCRRDTEEEKPAHNDLQGRLRALEAMLKTGVSFNEFNAG